MKLNIDPDWFLQMVEKENSSIVSVGGFFARVQKSMEAKDVLCNNTSIEERPLSPLKESEENLNPSN